MQRITCFASADVIPSDARVSNLLTFIPLNNNEDCWEAAIEECVEIDVYEKVL